MFETILEKILQSKLGKYVEGFDQQNLSIGVSLQSLINYLQLDLEREHFS